MRQYFPILILLILLKLQAGSSLKCGLGSYEVQTINTTKTFCDACGNKNIHTPCETVKCTAETECKLIYQSSTDTADCTYGKIPLRPTCAAKCPLIKCSRDAVPTPIMSVDGCSSCYAPGPKDNFTNPCESRGACKASETCYLVQVECFTTPCYPLKKCCPNEVCPDNSLTYTDSNGCKRCYACNKCVNKKCSPLEKCVLQEVKCKQCPCPPRAKCVSKS